MRMTWETTIIVGIIYHSFSEVTRLLSPGQTARQVVASGRKLNLGRDLRWVAKRTSQFPRKYTQVAKKKKKLRQNIG